MTQTVCARLIYIINYQQTKTEAILLHLTPSSLRKCTALTYILTPVNKYDSYTATYSVIGWEGRNEGLVNVWL